jgi:hypothetical protein
MRRANALMELWPWAGLMGAGAAYALDHQVGSDGIFFACQRGLAWTTVVGVICLLITILCGFASFRLWRSEQETAARRLVALLGVMFALVLGLGITLATIAGFILPECLA